MWADYTPREITLLQADRSQAGPVREERLKSKATCMLFV